MPLLPILGGISAGANLLGGLGGLFGNTVDQINPNTDAQMAALNQAFMQAMQQYQAQEAQSQQIAGQMQATERDVAGVTAQIGQVEQPEAMDWYDNFLTTIPGFEQIAGNLADRATEDLGRSIQEQTQLRTQEAMTQAMNAFGATGGRSGAGVAALGQAIAQPMAAAQVAMTGQKAGIEAGAFGDLASQGMGLSAQGTQNEFQNAMNNLMQQLQGFGQQGALQQGRAGIAGQSAGLAAQMAQNVQGLRTQMADPIYREQQNPFAAIMGGVSGAANVLADPTFGFNWTTSK